MLLKELVKETDSILKERMDKLVAVFNDANPDFVSAYRSARNTIDPPFRKRKPVNLEKLAATVTKVA